MSLDDDFCRSCKQSHDCKQVYRQLGEAAGPSVLRKVLIAFLLPMAVFIVALTVSEKHLAEIIKSGNIRILANLSFALVITFFSMLLIKISNKKVVKKDKSVFYSI